MNDETEDKPKRGRPPKSALVKCEVLRDYWTADGDRVRKGTGVEVSAEDAMTGLENNTLKRIK